VGLELSNAKRYLILLFVSAMGGALVSLMGGLGAIIRGTLLAVSLSAAIPVINVFMVEKNRDSVWKSSLIGGAFGFLGGAIMFALQHYQPELMESVFEQPTLLPLIVSLAYGFIIHGTYAFYRISKKNQIQCFHGLFVAACISGTIRSYPLYIPVPDITALLIGLGEGIMFGSVNAALFVTIWFVFIHHFDPCFFVDVDTKQKLSSSFANAIFALIIINVPCNMIVGLNYNDHILLNNSENSHLLQNLRYDILMQNKIISATDENELKKLLPDDSKTCIDLHKDLTIITNIEKVTVQHRDGNVVLSFNGATRSFISPSGQQIAILYITPKTLGLAENLEIYELRTGKIISKTKGKFGLFLCWNKNEKSLVIEKYNNLDSAAELLTIDIANNQQSHFGFGKRPCIASDTGDIFYCRNQEIRCRRHTSQKDESICYLNFFRKSWKDLNTIAISPDGKMIIYTTPTCHELAGPAYFYILYDIASEKQHVLGKGSWTFKPPHWLRPEDWDMSMLKPQSTKEGGSKNGSKN